MKHTKVPDEQAVKLLKRLANDESFRGRMQDDPYAALKDFGLAEDMLSKVSNSFSSDIKLAGKTDYSRAYERLKKDYYDHKKLMMIIPMIRLSYGDNARPRVSN